MPKLLFLPLVFTWTFVAAGCNTSPGGIPGTDDSFKLEGGKTPISIKQGDSQSVKITVDRGKNFHKSVRLSAEPAEKITASFDRDLVKDGEPQDVNVKIHPAEDAPPGDYTVTLTGSSDTGSPARLRLAVKVVKK
jgi:uncharacterized membrane protein